MSQLQNQSGTIPASITGGPATAVAIASSTDTTPIHVLVASPQTWAQDGDTIRVEGHKTNVNANGLWQVAVVNSTELVLIGSTATGAGAGGATGALYDYNVTPTGVVPSNADLATGPSVATAVAMPFNAVPWLYERTGQQRLYRRLSAEESHAIGAVWSTNTAVPANGVQTVMASSSGFILGHVGGVIPVLYNGDTMRLRWGFGGTHVASASPLAITVALGCSVNGGGYGTFGDEFRLPQNLSDTSQPTISFSTVLEGIFLNSTGGNPGSQDPGATYDFCLMVRNYDPSNTVLVNLSGCISFEFEQFRSNA